MNIFIQQALERSKSYALIFLRDSLILECVPWLSRRKTEMGIFMNRTDGITEPADICDWVEEVKEESIKIDYKMVISTFGIVFSGFHLIVLLFRYLIAFNILNRIIISNNFFYIAIVLAGGVGSWILCTDTAFWNFRRRKRYALYVIVFNGLFTVLQPVYTVLWTVFVKLAFLIPITAAMTEGMVIMLAQLLLVGSFSGIIGFSFFMAKEALFSEEAKDKISKFKIKDHFDTRPNKENMFDEKVVKDLETGQEITIFQKDRFTHQLVNGASGTGKTSSVYTPQINEDMIRKIQNMEERQKELEKMILQKHAIIERHWNGPFKEKYIKPLSKYQSDFDELYKKYPDCGITVLAPNNSIIEDIIKLARAKHLPVNILDPAKDYDKYKNVRTCGMNPFYIPLGLSERERAITIAHVAQVFSDVLIAVNEVEGSQSDVYFTDISKSVTSNVAIAVMLAKNIEGKQADILDIQECIDDFTKLNRYVQTIETHENIFVEAPEIKKSKSNDVKATADRINMEEGMEGFKNIASKKEWKENAKKSPYKQTILFIKQELLGEGREKMFDQARGLRNMIDKLLLDLRLREILTADEEHRLDFDETLLDGEITVVNTALEFGQSLSTTFGLFFLLLQREAILKRKDKSSIHFLWIDEAPQYMHKIYDEMFTLYRQYNVSVTLAVQSLAQTAKNKTTAYLKDVFMEAGTHIVFGRLGTEEMKIYSELAGSKEVLMSQVTRAETSMLSENPNVTMSERTTPQQKANIEGSEMRQLDFQEVTILTVRDGKVLAGKLGKVAFVKKSDFLPMECELINWNRFNPKQTKEEIQKEKERAIQTEQKKIPTTETQRPSEIIENTMRQSLKDDEVPLEEMEQEEEPVSLDDLGALLFGAGDQNSESGSGLLRGLKE